MSFNDLKPDDPCGCGNGRRYGDCHGLIVGAPKGKQIGVGQRLYAQSWAVNAAQYQDQGLYAALASELVAAGGVQRVLDVGCGLGHGIEALSAAIPDPGRVIIGIDENPDCLASAAERLHVSGAATTLGRIKPELQLSGYYVSKVSGKPVKLDGDILLAQVDLMAPDPAFEAWLSAASPFDAVTLWFSGVHPARALTKIAQSLGAHSDADLREALEDEVMELAAKRLRPGGLVQMVQRAAGDMEPYRQQREAEVLAALADYPFDLVSVRAYPYAEPNSGAAVAVSSVFVDLSGRAQFALSTLMRRTDGPDAA